MIPVLFMTHSRQEGTAHWFPNLRPFDYDGRSDHETYYAPPPGTFVYGKPVAGPYGGQKNWASIGIVVSCVKPKGRWGGDGGAEVVVMWTNLP